MVRQELKSAYIKTGLVIFAIVILRLAATLASLAIYLIAGAENIRFSIYAESAVNILFLYIGGIISAALILGYKKSDGSGMLKKPERLGKAVFWVFPCYGAGQVMNIWALIITVLVGGANSVYQTLPFGAPYALDIRILTIVQAAVFAPIFEELLFRGIIMRKLAPYGNGFAIIMSALCFAIVHGNFQQLAFAFAIGILLGYIATVTGSILPTVIIHFIINSISSALSFLSTDETLLSALEKISARLPLSDSENTMLTVFGTFVVTVLLFAAVSVVAAIVKLRKHQYYRPELNRPDISVGERWSAAVKNPVFVSAFVVGIASVLLNVTALLAKL